ncbi:MAG: terminase small subunit [Eubacteriales bacterium]|nr:terminase small subunit [Eubacteriales bacterium]
MEEKRGRGRPPKYKTPEEMQIVIDQYFEECEGTLLTDKDGELKLTKYGEPIYIGAKPPTVTGLALALGFTSRLALLNYQDKEAFVNTVTRAKARVERYAETRLFDKDGANGAKFSLANNFRGWQEKQNVEMSGPGGGPIQYETMTAEERQERINELLGKA